MKSPSALPHPAIMFTIISYQSSDPKVSPKTKLLSYLGDYVSILIMEQAAEMVPARKF